jgi:hypothetical protein
MTQAALQTSARIPQARFPPRRLSNKSSVKSSLVKRTRGDMEGLAEVRQGLAHG